MPANSQELEKLIQTALPGAIVQITDMVGDGDHLQAVVVSDLFAGKSRLERHQMVYGALKDILKEQLHALALKTWTPAQWEAKK